MTGCVFSDFITEFQRRLDAAEPIEAMAVEKARLISPGSVLEGRAAIDAHVTARRPNRRVRHGWSGLRIRREGDRAATLSYLATAYHGDDMGKLTMITVGDVTDRLIRDDSGAWRLVESRFERIFKQEY